METSLSEIDWCGEMTIIRVPLQRALHIGHLRFLRYCCIARDMEVRAVKRCHLTANGIKCRHNLNLCLSGLGTERDDVEFAAVFRPVYKA